MRSAAGNKYTNFILPLLRRASCTLTSILYSNLFISAVAVLMFILTTVIFKLDVPAEIYPFIFFATLFSYSFHALVTTKKEPETLRGAWNKSNRYYLSLMLAGSGLLAIHFFLYISYLWIYLLPLGLATFLYSAPNIELPAVKWLRKIAIGKTFYLAVVWTLITVVLPFFITQTNLSVTEFIYIINRFLLIYIICIFFDYRDREKDKRKGIRNIITYLEKDVLLKYVVFPSIVAGILSSIYLGIFFNSIFLGFSLLLPFILISSTYRKSINGSSDFWYYFVLDGAMAVSAIYLIL